MRGQLQSLEPVLIVVVLGILLGVGLLFMVRLGDSQADLQRSIVEEREAIALLKKVTALPELSCPRSETVETFCIDLAKADAFAAMLASEDSRTAYYPLLGASDIDLEWVDEYGTYSMTLYDTLSPDADVRASTTYFTVYDPVYDSRSFAIITVRREVA